MFQEKSFNGVRSSGRAALVNKYQIGLDMNNQQIFLKKDSNETVNLDTLIVNQSLQQKEFEKLVYQNYVKPNQFNVDQTLQNTD